MIQYLVGTSFIAVVGLSCPVALLIINGPAIFFSRKFWTS